MRNKRTTVGELRKAIEGLPDDTVVLAPYSDHTYKLVGGQVTEVALSKDHRGGRIFSEWFGDPKHYDGPVEVVKALVIE